MSKFCPITGGKIVYLECLECADRVCEKNKLNISILPKREDKSNTSNADENKQKVDKIPGAVGFNNPTQTGKRGPHPACETCCHKTGESTQNAFGVTHVTYCEIHRNYLINSEEVSWEGCPYHNKDMSQEKICMNCDHYLGGGDWGLACAADYHKLPNALSAACEKFKKTDTTE